MTLGEKIKQLRDEKNISRRRFSELTQIPQAEIKRIEEGKTTDIADAKLERIAVVLEFTADDVMDVDSPEMAHALGIYRADEKESGIKIGKCNYCGQTQVITDKSFDEQDAADAYVTRRCSCAGAKELRKKEEEEAERKRKIEMANYSIQTLIEDQGFMDVAGIMREAVSALVDCNIRKVTIGIESGLSATIMRDSDGKVTVEKRQTVVESMDSE